ncbi:membrane protein [Novosphingobium malaysiense]|uniref:Membrane protein n=1 Tax=Novosphingobium malaysiense TaxID=1348853 RepID=A0A0B1ZWV3_9SPHN|nr:membrane protein [Novosphingobium malaysiense]
MEPPYVVRIGEKLAIPRDNVGSESRARASATAGVHVVAPGETLNGIANRAGVSSAALAEANGLKPPFPLRVGQKLTLPGQAAPVTTPTASRQDRAGFHIVEPGETLSGIANRTGVASATLAEANGIEPPYIIRAGQKLAIPGENAPRTASRVIETRQPAATAASGSPETESVHVVEAGETLGGIAARAKVPRVLIAEANGLQPPFIVRVGQKLQIPRTRRYTVASGDTGFSIAMKYGMPWEQIALANGMEADAPVKAGQDLLIPTLLNPPQTGASKFNPSPVPKAAQAPAPAKMPRFGWPVSGPIRRGYATGSDYHDGLDIQAAKGTMVRAAATGTVKFAGKEKEQFGNLVVIDHGDGWYTAYGFLSRITVKEGAKVAAGERIGLVGDTGLAKGNELHFEVRQDGKPVDPLDELPKAP